MKILLLGFAFFVHYTFLDCRNKFLDIDWLGKITVKTGGLPLFYVCRHGVGAEGNCRDNFCIRIFLKFLQDFKSV